MKIFYAPYERAFVEPYRYGEKLLGAREGIVLKSADGRFYSEASPLPGHSRETLVQVRKQLDEGTGDGPLPSLRFGMAGLRAQIDLRDFARPLRSNALLPWRGLNHTTDLARAKIDEGYRCLKLKLQATALDEQRALLARFPETKFRLDANGAVPAELLRKFLRDLDPAQIDYLEEPGTWDAESPVPLAADESAADPAGWPALLEGPHPPQVLVVKPTVLGGLGLPADAAPARLTYTTTLEAEPGRRALLALLATSGRVVDTAGLATGFLFRENFLADRPEWTSLPPVAPDEQRWLDSLAWKEAAL